MNKKFSRKFVYVGLVLIVGVGFGLHTNVIKLPIQRQIHEQFAVDLNDDRVLVGASHNVFVAKVIRKTGQAETELGISTQFLAEVLYNIKGDLDGDVSIEQEGGYRDGILYTVSEGDMLTPEGREEELLQPGYTYLFATRENQRFGWHTLISHTRAIKIISDQADLSVSDLESIIKRDARVLELEEAYKNQILLDVEKK